jgi:hypothetical protein
MGNDHVCALLVDGAVKCWGDGGKLGLGDRLSRGYAPGQMGDNLPVVPLGTGLSVRQLSAHYAHHTCALFATGAVKCWGRGGALGLGDTRDRGVAPGEMGDALPFVDVGP